MNIERFSESCGEGGGVYEDTDGDYVLAADYDALAAELATERLRADVAVKDANDAERRVAELQALKARVAELESALRLAKPCVKRDLKAAVKENFGYVNNDPWACAAVDARNAIDAALAGHSEDDPDEPALAEAEQPVIYPEDGRDERAALSTALFNALESYGASRGKFSRKDQKIHAKQCELIRQHAAQLLAGQPAAVNERDLERYRALRTLVDGGEWLAGSVTITDKSGNSTNEWAADAADLDAMLDNLLHWAAIRPARATLAPAAAVMPERMTTIPEGKTISYAAGYEAALDAVANLNRNTVPLELLERIPHEWNCGTLGGLRRAIDELRAILGAKP